MKRILLFLFLATSLARAQVALDVSIQQVNAGGTGFNEVLVPFQSAVTTLASYRSGIGLGTEDAATFSAIAGTTGTFSSLTSGRVPFVSTAGLLVDDARFVYAANTLRSNSTGNGATINMYYQNSNTGDAVYVATRYEAGDNSTGYAQNTLFGSGHATFANRWQVSTGGTQDYYTAGSFRFGIGATLSAGTGPTTLTDSAGKILSAALNTVAIAQGGTGATTLTGSLIGNGTSAFTAATSSTVGQVYRVTGANTFAFGAVDLADADAVTGVFAAANIPKADVLTGPLYAADAGSTDDYVITLSPAITAYVTGAHYWFKANTVNTGAATININSVGAKTIVKVAGGITTALATNDIRAGQWVDLVYDGTNMQMQSTLGNAAGGGGTPGGSDTQVQFNDASAFGGDAAFVFNKTTGLISTTGAYAKTANAMGALAIDVTKAVNTKSITAISTFTFSATAATGAEFGLLVTADASGPYKLTIPSSFSISQQRTVTSVMIAPSSSLYLRWVYYNSVYYLDGDLVYNNAATGNYSYVSGLGAAQNATNISGDDNVFIGNDAGRYSDIAAQATYVGYNAGRLAKGGANTFIGFNAGAFNGYVSALPSQVYIGYNAGANVRAGSGLNIGIGVHALEQTPNGPYPDGGLITGTIALGYYAGASAYVANYSQFIGSYAGQSATSAADSTFIGREAGKTAADASKSVFIGSYAGSNRANTLWIDTQAASENTYTPMIYGEFDNRKLVVNGTLHIPNSNKRVGTQFDKAGNTTLGNVTDLSVALLAATTYRFRTTLFVDADTTGGQKFAIAISSAPTAIIYQINSIANSTNLNVINSRQTASAGSAGTAGATAYFTTIEGTVVTNAAANITVQFAQNAATGTSSVLVGSWLEVLGF